MNTTYPRRILSVLNRRRRDTLLRVLAAILAVTMLASGLARTAPARADGATYPPADLLNLSQPLYAATPAQVQSLENLEQQAVANTLQDHGLPASDAAAAQTWGRDEAESELWGLLVQAIQTPQASRTADQQNAVDWLTAVEQREGVRAADDAGLEYVKWAGLDQTGYQNLLATNPSQSALQSFLSGSVLNYNNSNTSQATGGYCVYRSPAPYASEYTGYNDQTCFTPCTNLLGCNPPTPSYDQFVKWGEADVNNQLFDTADYAQEARAIAIGASLGGAVVAAGVTAAVISSTMSTVLASSAIQAAIFPTSAWTIGELTAAAGAAISPAMAAAEVGVMTAASVAAIAAIVIVAVTLGVLEGINVFSAAALPGQLATLIADAPGNTPDLGAILADSTKTQGLYGLFVGATLPTPRFATCDNSAPIIGGAGQSAPAPCLNAPPIPGPSNDDPEFAIQAKGATTTTYASSISWQDTLAQVTLTARISGNWFVEQITPSGGSPITAQTLRIYYTDWNGDNRIAWLIGNPTNGYTFVGVKDPAETGAPLNPSTCLADGTCSSSSSIDYVGTDGNDYSASVFLTTPTVAPTTSANPVEGSPVTFTANGSSSVGLPITYQWQFEQVGQVAIGCLQQQPCSPYNYTDPVSGATASYTWPTSGTFHVQLTATDSSGKQTVDTFTVKVGDVPPTLALTTPCPYASPCDTRTVSTGSAATLTGTITHAGSADTETVTVDWGDGTTDTQNFGPNPVIIEGTPLTLTGASPTTIKLSDTHTYATAGTYLVKVTVSDQSGGHGGGLAGETVQQDTTTVNWPDPAPITYGQALGAAQLDATATYNGAAVAGTYDYTVDNYPIANPVLPAGQHTLTVDFVPNNDDRYSVPAPASVPITVFPAPLTITANDQSMTYGGAVPAFTASSSGLVN